MSYLRYLLSNLAMHALSVGVVVGLFVAVVFIFTLLVSLSGSNDVSGAVGFLLLGFVVGYISLFVIGLPVNFIVASALWLAPRWSQSRRFAIAISLLIWVGLGLIWFAMAYRPTPADELAGLTQPNLVGTLIVACGAGIAFGLCMRLPRSPMAGPLTLGG